MVGYTLAHPVAVAFSGLPLALVSACGCIGVKESERFSGRPNPLIRIPKALGSSSDRSSECDGLGRNRPGLVGRCGIADEDRWSSIKIRGFWQCQWTGERQRNGQAGVYEGQVAQRL